MSGVATGRDAGEGGEFRGLTVALMLGVGILGFVGMLVLGAFAPDLRSGNDGGTHALSNAATGFSGIVRLAQAMGRNPRIIRDDHQLGSENLLVLTPPDGTTNILPALSQRQGKATLIVFPKWMTMRDAQHRGWVDWIGTLPNFMPEGVMAPANQFKVVRRKSGGRLLAVSSDLPETIRFASPRPVQVITKVKLGHAEVNGVDRVTGAIEPLITDGNGGVVLAKLADAPVYILADPDILSNLGMADPKQAASALALLDWLNSNEATGIDFDVTLNGLGHSPSPLKLAFTPPFLAMTLAIAAALLLAALQALARFGAARRQQRAIAFGKAALVDNAAMMVRKAGREATLGGRYGEVIRDRAAAAFGAPARLKGAALDQYLDRLGGRRRKFSDLAAAASHADDRIALVNAARALHDWQGEKTR